MERNSQRQAFEKEGQVFTSQPSAADPTLGGRLLSSRRGRRWDSRRWHRRQTSSTRRLAGRGPQAKRPGSIGGARAGPGSCG